MDHHAVMVAPDVLVFALGALPAPPARVLEIGAGNGALAAALLAAGHDVVAIDPAAADSTGVERVALLDARGSFDAAVAVVSLHHVEPLEESCAHLASLMHPGGTLVVDEFDIERLDERAAAWWLGQRRALGHESGRTPAEVLAELREHVHPLRAVRAALEPWFALGEPVRGPYLHRWALESGLRDAEERLIAAGRLPVTGARMVGRRRER
jgi:SAM-dependent methyltransferase